MDEDGQERVGVKISSKIDWLSKLPESLLYKVLLNLPTKDVVRTSVLSKRWKNLWRYVPGLDVDYCDFPDYKTFVSFVDAFFGFNSESYFESFQLNYDGTIGKHYGDNYEPEIGLVRRWINTVVDRRVKHLVVSDEMLKCDIEMPPTLYTCQSLVSLELYGVTLACPKFVSLPCLKFIDLTVVCFANALDLETLISSCPVLESFSIEQNCSDGFEVLRVCSQSLLRFIYVSDDFGDSFEEELVVTINAPRLQYLKLGDDRIASFILNNTSSLVEAYIYIVWNWSFKNDLQKRKMIRSFVEGISCVKDMTMTSKTLEVFYDYSKCEQLPLFCSLSSLRVRFTNFIWQTLTIFLESCPNLKSLVVAFPRYPAEEEISILSGPRCLPSSLQYVDFERPLKGEGMEMKLLSYFLENSTSLEKLTVCLDANMKTEKESALLKELLTIPRLSSSCQVVVL